MTLRDDILGGAQRGRTRPSGFVSNIGAVRRNVGRYANLINVTNTLLVDHGSRDNAGDNIAQRGLDRVAPSAFEQKNARLLYPFDVIRRSFILMTFNGCKGAPCKCAAVGVVCLCVAAMSHGQFCEQQHRATYCNPAWDLPHGPHSDQPTINWVRTVVSSTSSSSTAMETNTHFLASFKPTKLYVSPILNSWDQS
jgi:hypothetical protein